jgi:hypothetical protein
VPGQPGGRTCDVGERDGGAPALAGWPGRTRPALALVPGQGLPCRERGPLAGTSQVRGPLDEQASALVSGGEIVPFLMAHSGLTYVTFDGGIRPLC